MLKLRNKATVAVLVALSLGGCNPPKLPDPTVEYPTPPAALMEPSRSMQPIPTPTPTATPKR